MKVDTSMTYVYPLLIDCIANIQTNVIDKHNIPMRIFETSRTFERHKSLLKTHKTMDIVSRHLYDFSSDTKLYCTAVDYVYYDKNNNKYSWNMRDETILSWYKLFGNLVLDICPMLEWGGLNRKSKKYYHFQVKDGILYKMLNEIPCVLP